MFNVYCMYGYIGQRESTVPVEFVEFGLRGLCAAAVARTRLALLLRPVCVLRAQAVLLPPQCRVLRLILLGARGAQRPGEEHNAGVGARPLLRADGEPFPAAARLRDA